VVKTHIMMFWVMTACGLVGGYQHFRETLTCQVTCYHNPEDNMNMLYPIKVRSSLNFCSVHLRRNFIMYDVTKFY
jgi:hypothetical protein